MEKISFIPLTKDNISSIAIELAGKHESLVPSIEEIVDGFSCYIDEDDISCAFSLSNGCLAVRIFDMGRYAFPYPLALDTEFSDTPSCLEDVVRYCIIEELPIVFTDVPADEVSAFSELGYKTLEVKRETVLEGDDLSYRVKLLTECSELCEIPTVEGDLLTIDELTEQDISDYANLSRDESSISLWGYDYRNDMPDATDEYFFRASRGRNSADAKEEKNNLLYDLRYRGAYCGNGFGAGYIRHCFAAEPEQKAR